MTFYLVVFLAMFIGYSSGVNIVMKNGSLYHVYSQTLCYNEDYTFDCQNGNIVPVKNTFGLKPPEIQKHYHCTDGQHLPYPKECCQKNTSSDCLFDSSKDLIHVVKTCGYHSSCSGQKAGWTFIKRDSPVNCRYQSSMEDRGTLYTQYVETEYICRDTSDDVTLCPSQETKHSGKGIFLTSESYPKFAHKQTGFHCNCNITADNQHDVSAYIVDLRMCNEKTTRCGQRLNLYGTPDKEIVTTDLDTDVGFKMVSNSVHKLQFTQTDGKIPFHLWLYFYADGTEMSITCQPPDTFTTTTTTTTPLPTTVKSLSTESPSVKNVTNKKKPTTATTTVTGVSCPAGANIVMKNGSLYHIHQQSFCYNNYYNFGCQNGNIVPVKNRFGLKPPEVQKRYKCADGHHLPYRPECCQKNTSSDCFLDSNKDLIHVVKTCGYRSSCTALKAGWTYLRKFSPVNCRYQSSMKDSDTLYTQYVETEYICRDTLDDVTLCPSQETKHSGKGIFLTSESYPNFAPKETGFHCNCTITADNQHDVSAYVVDLRMCNEKNTRCGQRLNLYGTPDKEIVITDFYADVGFKMVSNSVHKLQFTQTDGKIPFHLWLYFYADGNEMSITCQPPDTFTTTTTTTSALPTGVSCAAGCINAEECPTIHGKLKHYEMQQQVADYEKKFDYLELALSVSGGFILGACLVTAVVYFREKNRKLRSHRHQHHQPEDDNGHLDFTCELSPQRQIQNGTATTAACGSSSWFERE